MFIAFFLKMPVILMDFGGSFPLPPGYATDILYNAFRKIRVEGQTIVRLKVDAQFFLGSLRIGMSSNVPNNLYNYTYVIYSHSSAYIVKSSPPPILIWTCSECGTCPPDFFIMELN